VVGTSSLLCSLVTGFLFPGTSPLEPLVNLTTQRLQVSDCKTFLMMCDVPSMAFFGKQSIECCPGIVSRFCNLLLTVPMAPMITGMTKHFMFYIH
jgi:hypothetical protein